LPENNETVGFFYICSGFGTVFAVLNAGRSVVAACPEIRLVGFCQSPTMLKVASV